MAGLISVGKPASGFGTPKLKLGPEAGVFMRTSGDRAMPSYEEELALLTFKDEGWPVERRVFQTLIQEPRLSEDRMAKLLGLIVGHLANSGRLTDEAVDDLLWKITH